MWSWLGSNAVGVCDEYSDLYSAILLHKLTNMSISSGADKCNPLCYGIKQLWSCEVCHCVPQNKGQGFSFFVSFPVFWIQVSELPGWVTESTGKVLIPLGQQCSAWDVLVSTCSWSVLRMNSPESVDPGGSFVAHLQHCTSSRKALQKV